LLKGKTLNFVVWMGKITVCSSEWMCVLPYPVYVILLGNGSPEVRSLVGGFVLGKAPKTSQKEEAEEGSDRGEG
jgi:hypothetical protein